MSYSALFNSGFRQVELSEDAKSDRNHLPIQANRPSGSSSTSAQPRRIATSHGPSLSPLPSAPPHHPSHKHPVETQSVRSIDTTPIDALSVKSWHPPSNSKPQTRNNAHDRSKRYPQGNHTPSSAHLLPHPQTLPSPTSSTPPWQHRRQEKRRSFSFLYMTDSPLDIALEEEETYPQRSAYRREIPVPRAPTPAPTQMTTFTRPRRSSYASTTAARSPTKYYREPAAPEIPSTIEHDNKRKQSIFRRIFHRKDK